jgi:hypothetical protein
MRARSTAVAAAMVLAACGETGVSDLPELTVHTARLHAPGSSPSATS